MTFHDKQARTAYVPAYHGMSFWCNVVF